MNKKLVVADIPIELVECAGAGSAGVGAGCSVVDCGSDGAVRARDWTRKGWL